MYRLYVHICKLLHNYSISVRYIVYRVFICIYTLCIECQYVVYIIYSYIRGISNIFLRVYPYLLTHSFKNNLGNNSHNFRSRRMTKEIPQQISTQINSSNPDENKSSPSTPIISKITNQTINNPTRKKNHEPLT